jgi:DNA-binding HxlR family transcriptional regulator
LRIGLDTRRPFPEGAYCPDFHRAAELVGQRWTGTIVRALLHGVSRFSDLRVLIPGLSDRMLTERLRTLEDEGIVERHDDPDDARSVLYRLTPKGEALSAVVAALADWATDWKNA